MEGCSEVEKGVRTGWSQLGLGKKVEGGDGVRAEDAVMEGEEPEIKGKW